MSSVLLDTPALAEREAALPVVSFSIQAVAEPGVMPRVLELFPKRGLVPDLWHSAVTARALAIEVHMAGVERNVADYIARCMRQIAGVDAVLTSERRGPS